MRSGRASFVIAALVMSLVAAIFSPVAVSAAVPTTEDGISFYGTLELPARYFSHPESEAPINRLQPGTVVLHNSHTTIQVPVQKDGAFTIYNLPYGTYLLQADYHDFLFPTVKVDVQYKERAAATADGEDPALAQKLRVPVVRASSNDFPVKSLRGSGVDEQSPTVIPAAAVHQYYVPREEFRITDMLKNPMIIMMLVSFSLMGMMKLFPEEDMKESQKMSKEWQRKLFNKAQGAADARAAPASIEKKRS